jgi:hypothetical protein
MEKTLKNALIKSCSIIMKDSLDSDDTLVLEIEFCCECLSKKVSYVLSTVNLDYDDKWVVNDIGMSLIPLIMKTVYANSFEDISGKYCRITLDESGNVSDLYNIIHSDDFVNLYDSFEVYNQ